MFSRKPRRAADFDATGASDDETRTYRPGSGPWLEGAADETRVYRPVMAAVTERRLAMKQKFRELAQFAHSLPTLPMRRSGDATAARLTAVPTLAPRPRPASSRVSRPRPVARTRWDLLLILVIVALPAGLFLYPAPAAKPAAVQIDERATPTTLQEPARSAHVIKDSVVPQVSVTAPRAARRARGESAGKPAATDPSGQASPPDPAQTLER